MKNLLTAAIAVALLLVFFAVAFQIGKSAGFETGSEWALVQADIVAREAGVSMPVYLDDGTFRVVFKQPPGLYQKAWRLADKYDRTVGGLQMAKVQRLEEKKEQICRQTDF